MPAPPLANTLEGGTDAVTITTGNSGGGSGDAFSGVTIGAGCTCAFSAEQMRDTLSAKFAMPATGAVTHVNWSGFGSLTVNVFYRFYVYKLATPPGNWFGMARTVNDVSARCADVGIKTTDKLRFGDAADTEIAALASTISIPNNQWVRIEVRVLPSTTVGEIEWRLYLSADSTSIDETKSATGLVLTANVDGLRFGIQSTPTNMNNQSWYQDNLAVATDTWLGPAAGAGGGGLDSFGPARYTAFHPTFGPF